MSNGETNGSSQRLLVKLRPSLGLRAAETAGTLRPLHDSSGPGSFGVAAGGAAWYVAELPEGGAHPWELAHARLADRLGVAAEDVLFAEPDLVHSIYPDPSVRTDPAVLAAVANCVQAPQDGQHGKAVGPAQFAWHLGDGFSQLGTAQQSVQFAAPRTRIAHLDTGYSREHISTPQHVLTQLERSFVDGENGGAQDPDRWRLVLDNSGHGTGTLGILAGRAIPGPGGGPLGGAPEAEILPLRIADTVVLLRTSAFARALRYALANGCDVVSMSMGGLPSRAWNEAVNEAYLAGVVIVCAAGNNYNGLPTRRLVYPARYGRVLAACGVMANQKSYTFLDGLTMEGNYGPAKKMGSAMAAYTPNIPWARFGCPQTIDLDGQGTSSATPQVAAAAALWLEKHKARLPRDWRRVEAVRHALFSSAQHPSEKLGRGRLRAFDALAVQPALDLPQTPADSDSWAFLRILTGLGIMGPTPSEEMFNLELAQRWMQNPELQELVPDPDETGSLDEATLKKVMGAILADQKISRTLRKHVEARYPALAGGPPPGASRPAARDPSVPRACDAQPALRDPGVRRLRVYAADPSLSARLDTADTNEVVLGIRWESLEKGPKGEYLVVEDKEGDGPKAHSYEPVDLDDPRLLARDGWAPSEGNPQFHQQMCYAVAMKTIEHFEHALGRPVLWRPSPKADKPQDDSTFVRQLKIHPHALRQANAFYSPREIALHFGYFDVEPGASGDLVPESRVYTCLSHDIIAHETTHAILDGMYRRFNEPSNPDVLALHEGFADIVALLQHFTIPEVLERELAAARGDLELESRLGSLAVQFGQATGGRGALREAIGRVVDGKWTRLAPDPTELARRLTPHARGAILVAAVFDAFLAIYKERTADLLRLATGGSGVLPAGALHPDLVRRLAAEASKSARHVLTMCIRALDYLPPVDVTFYEFLRGLITADYDMVSVDSHGYRVALVEAFRRRGIHPATLDLAAPGAARTLSVETLRWRGIDLSTLSANGGKADRKAIESQYGALVSDLKEYADACFYVKSRAELFRRTRSHRLRLHGLLERAFTKVPAFARELGIDPGDSFEVHELRRALRPSPRGAIVPQVIVALTQSQLVAADPASGTPEFRFRGGSTLVIDLAIPEVTYRIVKNVKSEHRQARTAAFLREASADPLRRLFLLPMGDEPFSLLHSLGGC